MSTGSFCKRLISLFRTDICDSCFDIGIDRFGSGGSTWEAWMLNEDVLAVCGTFSMEKSPDDDDEETKHRCLRFLFHLGCLWIIFQRQKGGESSYWASLLILTWLRGGTHTLAASATLFHQQLPQHFTLLNTILPSTHPCHNCLLRHPSVFNYFYISLFQHC